MSIVVAGYDWCSYYKATCLLLKSSNIPFSTILCSSRLDMKKKIRAICRGNTVLGVHGFSSPQIFRVEACSIVCVGGHDDLVRIGVSNLLAWLPLNF